MKTDYIRRVTILVITLFLLTGGVLAGNSGTADQISDVAKGDLFTIRGVATGNTDSGVAIWLIGDNYYSYNTISVDADNTYSFELTPAMTSSLAAGEYYAVVQSPGASGDFAVYPKDNSPSAGQTSVKSTSGGEAFIISGPDKPDDPSEIVTALVEMINSPYNDNSCTTTTFLLNNAWIKFNEMQNQYTRVPFTIVGTTNLAPGNDIIVSISTSEYKLNPDEKEEGRESGGLLGKAAITISSPSNEWGYSVDMSGYNPGEYIVTATDPKNEGNSQVTKFSLIAGIALTQPPIPATTPGTPVPPPPSEPVPEPTTAAPAPVISLVSLLITGIVMQLARKIQ
ncbi:MAG: hypothetical protein U9N40_05115 [Euryarchaeota archaeon]|nr:hypothetical protein [Euryarchaeota archaeon]